eukprot:TRINITY_DN3366_c1_g1_i2.p1 TRINITY_DN3366_c1_g1~~TRINITY_DN3366_c1_g1_i2.p1  ORF type:complete len:260 (+),score=41.82 TRINITY_DN3366_c1_g1_i2:56-835(+)
MTTQRHNENSEVSSVVSSNSSTPSTSHSSAGSYTHNPYGCTSSKDFYQGTPKAPETLKPRVPMVSPIEGLKITDQSKPRRRGGKLCWVVLVQFKFGRTGKFYSNQEILSGTNVIVQADRGQDMGVVCSCEARSPVHSQDKTIQKILKQATPSEIEKWVVTLSELEREAKASAQGMVDRKGIPLQITHAEYQFDTKKLTFHFTSKDAHPNFRDILDEAFSTWKCRIWFARYSRSVTDAECRKRLAILGVGPHASASSCSA